MGFGLNLKQLKAFWTSKSVKISMAIFLGIAALMGVIVLVSLLVGCGTGNQYTRVKQPTLMLENVGNHGNISMAYMIIANPTSERLHSHVKCCVPYDATQCIDTYAIVPPRSDKRIRVGTVSALRCQLLTDTSPGSTR